MAGQEPREDLAGRLESQAEFVGSVTHALKGVLNGLQGGLYLLESGMSGNDARRVEGGAAMIKQNAARARSLVSNILYYARERQVLRENLVLREMVSRSVEACRPAAMERGIGLEASTEDGTFSADRAGVQALLCNLLELAAEQATGEANRESRSVRLRARMEPPWVIFEVAHGGTALDRETLAGALGPTFKPAGADRAGLWVHAARRVCEAHGGFLRVETLVPAGERFIAGLPGGGLQGGEPKNLSSG